MKTWQHTLLGIFLGMILLAAVLIASQQPRGKGIELLPAASPAPVMIQVAGEVRTPGLYDLPPGSRIQDAVAAAGGFAEKADQGQVNLAARLKDGEKVVIPAIPTPAPTLRPGEQPVEVQPTAEPTVSFPIDLNTATVEELDALPGIGPGRAQDIIAYREKNGGFKRIEEIKNVPGIGDSTFDGLKDFITVESP